MSNILKFPGEKAEPKPVITRVQQNWYMARVPGAVFFAYSRSEAFLKWRHWALGRIKTRTVRAVYRNAATVAASQKEVG